MAGVAGRGRLRAAGERYGVSTAAGLAGSVTLAEQSAEDESSSGAELVVVIDGLCSRLKVS